MDALRKLFWIGSSKNDLERMPEEVRRSIGFALIVPSKAKCMHMQRLYTALVLLESLRFRKVMRIEPIELSIQCV